MTAPSITISPVESDADRAWLERVWTDEWGGLEMVTRGRRYLLHDLDGFVARKGDRIVGAATFVVENGECELMSINAVESGAGIGTALLDRIETEARERGCHRIWMITTNDNVDALRFYQRRGYRLDALHRGAVDESRTLKPTIPRTGFYGIPIHDEIELEKDLRENDRE